MVEKSKLGLGEYQNNTSWKGYLETKDKIAFVAVDGSWTIYTDREPNGAVIGKPITIH